MGGRQQIQASGVNALGHRIKWLRFRAGLTQVEMASLMGVAQPRVSEWERGKACDLRLDTLRRLAKALGTTVGGLVGE